MSKPRITGAMLRPRSSPPRTADQTAAVIKVKPAETSAQEAVASHPMFVAPQFGYRRNPPSTDGR